VGIGDVSLMFRMLGDSSGVVKASDEAGDAGEKMGDRFGKLKETTAAAGAAAGAALMVGLLGAMENEKATDKLAAQLGAGSPIAESAGRVAGELWADAYGESITDAADAVKTVLQGGLLAEDATDAQIKDMTASVMAFATTWDQEVQGSVNAVGQMLRTGLAPNAQAAMDILTRGMQQGGDKAQDLLDTFNEYSTQFRRVGLDGTTAMGLISQALKAGARDSDQVADAIGQFGERALAGGKPVEDAYKSIGLNAGKMAKQIGMGGKSAEGALATTLTALRNTKDEQVRLNAAAQLFGDPANVMGAALFAMDLDTAAMSMGNVEGAANKAATALNDNAATTIEKFKRTAQQGFTEAAAAAVTWGQKNQTVVMAAAAILGTLGLTYAAVRAGQMAWVAIQGVSTAATGVATAAQWLWNAALTANPIGIVIAAIAALVAGLIWFFTQTTLGRAIFSTAMQGISTAFGWVWDKLQAGFTWVKANWPLLLAILTGPIGLAVLAISRNWDTIMAGLRYTKSYVTSTARGMWDGISSAFRTAINFLIRGWNRLQFTVPSFNAFGQQVGGFTVGVPGIAPLATGGIVTAPTLALLGEAGPEAVVPLGRGGIAPTINVYVTAGAIGSEDYLVRVVSNAVGQAIGQGTITGAFTGASY
jgi:hypothetical protein